MTYKKLFEIYTYTSTILGIIYFMLSPLASAQTWLTSARNGKSEEIEFFSSVSEITPQPAKQAPLSTDSTMNTFLDWCENRDNLNPEAKHTVEVILERIRIQDCQRAYQKLLSTTSLELSSDGVLLQERINDLSPLSSLVHLEELDLSDNEISDLTPLSSLVNLRTLYLNDGTKHRSRYVVRHGEEPLDLTPLASLKNLQNLQLAHNVITDLNPLASLKELRILVITGIGVSGYSSDITAQYNRDVNLMVLSNLTNLHELHIGRNPHIKDFTPISSLINLQLLVIEESKLQDISFVSNLINLKELYIFQNKITDITPLSNLTNLQKLYLFNNPNLQRIAPLSNLSQLKVLLLGNNSIQDLSPLSSLTNLEELHLWDNEIRDVTPLSTLKNLQVLELSQNRQLRDISSLSALTNLQLLRLYGNFRLVENCPLPRESVCVWD